MITKKQKQQPIKRLYQLWHKSNRFYFNGRLVTGPKSDFPISIAPYIVFTIVFGIYSYFILTDMFEYNLILCVAFLISFTATITFMLLTSYSDPSIIPQRPFLLLQQQQIQQQYSDNYQQLLQLKKYQRLQYLLYQCSDPNQVFCQTCHIYRPQSTSHCRQCDNCILQIDHHCPWLNTCVGRNNYKWFILFICSLIVMMLGFCCNVLVWVDGVVIGGNNKDEKDNDNQNNDTMLNVYVIMCLIIVGALIIVILAFCMFHIFLLCKGKTTRQFIKQSKQKNKNIKKNKSSLDKQQQSNKQQPFLETLSQIRDSLIIVRDQFDTVDKQKLEEQRQGNSQNQSGKVNSIKVSNTKDNNTKQNNRNIQNSQQLLDHFIQSQYRQSGLFYKQLFKPISRFSNIYFVNFSTKINHQEEQFLLKQFEELKQKRRALKQEGKATVYYKELRVENGVVIRE